MTLQFEPFDKRRHDRARFTCRELSLDDYIQKQASQDLKRRIAAVFVLVDSPDDAILGYYTLSSYSVELSELGDKLVKRLPNYPKLPATLLGRLAVDINYRGRGLGELLLLDALQRSLQAATQIASLAVVVDALDEQAAKFYQKYGFQRFRHNPLKLYLPMKSIEFLFPGS
ncbi:GNAT family N-acetyltransferase [Synechococcus sp. PCC 7336]|uniref:GNAT family N-acetyltransferase n=1 Tax=Synechococcus sp. PCC 7336 TaxID=195250 RepID=UPI000347F26D|nr:GNAT family N-acetyltransferase [Synechococcus sp. PCC 7336]